jgi:hypothetical protein
LPNGINAANVGGTSINLDKNDSADDAFEALFTPLSIYTSFIYLKILREDGKTSTNGVSLTEDAKITLYLGYNVDDPDPPSTPTNFKIAKNSLPPYSTAELGTTLSWSASSNASSYKIERRIGSNGTW